MYAENRLLPPAHGLRGISRLAQGTPSPTIGWCCAPAPRTATRHDDRHGDHRDIMSSTIATRRPRVAIIEVRTRFPRETRSTPRVRGTNYLPRARARGGPLLDRCLYYRHRSFPPVPAGSIVWTTPTRSPTPLELLVDAGRGVGHIEGLRGASWPSRRRPGPAGGRLRAPTGTPESWEGKSVRGQDGVGGCPDAGAGLGSAWTTPPRVKVDGPRDPSFGVIRAPP
eukprot:scaffold4783_cov373-Prasinococcus_capsulatus_cf.AAC.6